MDKKSKWALGMGGLAVLASLNFAMSTYNSRKANNHIEKLETWRSKVVKGCVESVVENEASHFLRSKYPGYEACGKANRDYDVQTECYPSDPEMSLWGSVRNAFISGYVSVDPYPSSREYLLPIVDQGRKVRAEAEKKCSEDPISTLKYLP
ncbi:MAG TPA: hypothetical protein VJA18_06690 [Candidatus Nanoarchaeia archaeon]|nr:hypothetical protein [Candidatus Nanoarchaeia archaeon]